MRELLELALPVALELTSWLLPRASRWPTYRQHTRSSVASLKAKAGGSFSWLAVHLQAVPERLTTTSRFTTASSHRYRSLLSCIGSVLCLIPHWPATGA